MADPGFDRRGLVVGFFEAWNRGDLDAILSGFGPDPVYADMPLPPRVGLEAIRHYIASVFENYSIRIETLRLAVSGDFVFSERIDHLSRGGLDCPLPVAGVMELREGGITAWRDYLDLGTVDKALGITSRPWVEGAR